MRSVVEERKRGEVGKGEKRVREDRRSNITIEVLFQAIYHYSLPCALLILV
jgi:hypothetical protein